VHNNGAITLLPADQIQRITTEVMAKDSRDGFDKLGNANYQEILTEYYEPLNVYADADGFADGDLQHTWSYDYDTHGQVGRSETNNYAYVNDVETLMDHQTIVYKEYDVYGNAVEQTIDTHEAKDLVLNAGGTVSSGNYVNRQHIWNVYENAKARARGNVTKTTAITYLDSRERAEDQIERTITTTGVNDFDNRGNALKQTSTRDIYVTSPETSQVEWVQESYTTTNLGDHDNRGNALYQDVATYQTNWTYADLNSDGIDNDGDGDTDDGEEFAGAKSWVDTLVDFQVMTNRVFDSRGNTKEERVKTYERFADVPNVTPETTDDRVGSGSLTEVKEIRSSNYHRSGVAGEQKIATYGALLQNGQIDLTSLIEAQLVDNDVIDSQGNVWTSIVTTYENATIIPGDIQLLEQDQLQRVTTSAEDKNGRDAFDKFGNANYQDILTEFYDTSDPLRGTDDFFYGDRQNVWNYGFDAHGQVMRSEIDNYSYIEGLVDDGTNTNTMVPGLVKTLIDHQTINYLEYDVYGNAIEQTIDTYDGDTPVTRDLDPNSGVVTSGDYVNRQHIFNEFFNAKGRSRGNATKNTSYTYEDKLENSPVEMTITTSDVFDNMGNAIKQTSKRDVYITDPQTLQVGWVKESETETNLDQYKRGNAGYQDIVTYQWNWAFKDLNTNGADDDSDGQIDEGDEFSSIEYEWRKTLVDFMIMTNRDFDARGNVLGQFTKTYEQFTDVPNSTSGTQDDRVGSGAPIQIQEIRSLKFHTSGVAKEQHIVTYEKLDNYGQADVSSILDAQKIKNEIVDSQGNVWKSIATTFSTASVGTEIVDGTTVNSGPVTFDPEKQMSRRTTEVTGREFDKFGNVLEQDSLTEFYEPQNPAKDAEGFVLGENQFIQNYDYDAHGQVGRSEIDNFAYIEALVDDGEGNMVLGLMKDFTDHQTLTYIEYDVYGNALEQTADTYRSSVTYDADGKVTGGAFIDRQHTWNEYLNAAGAIRGNATYSNSIRYDNIAETYGSEIEKTFTETTLFDNFGNAMVQAAQKSIFDDTHAAADENGWVKESWSVSHFGNNNIPVAYTIRGDA